MGRSVLLLFFFLGCFAWPAPAQTARTLSGIVLTREAEAVPDVVIEVRTFDGRLSTETDAEGRFRLEVPVESFAARFSGRNMEAVTRVFAPSDQTENIEIRISYIVPPLNETVTIQADSLSPEIENRNDAVYKNYLFGRDDQLIFSLNAGISAGQHEGGGKSLEIRRFGFNLDHGGAAGGLKILVDNIQQNQATQGHGQGYLGSLKSIMPELVEGVAVISGPFSAAYGDFSGLGVVQIRQRESLPHQLTFRVQTGSFNTVRSFLAYSPPIKNIDSFVAYEFSRTDGPFRNPLEYRRDNLTANFTRKFGETQSIGLKFNAGRSDFNSSGQLPLDEVGRGNLDRFGFLDPDNGGTARLGTLGLYFRRARKSGATLKLDAFVTRSLVDLFSNFTFYLNDPIYGDEIQQHDSRLQEGASVQYLQPYKFFGRQSLLTVGGNFHASQINVGLYPSISRSPVRKFLPENLVNPDILLTSAKAKIANLAGYLQNSTEFFNGHLRLEAGLRWDYFVFDVDGFELGGRAEEVHRDRQNLQDKSAFTCRRFVDRVDPVDPCLSLRGKETASRLQPKLAAAWSPFERFPMTVYLNYGRGIASQDARGIVKNPDAPKLSTTDFYQAGTSYNSTRLAAVFSAFLIDRSNEQIYVPDDGSIELAGASRSVGFELRTSAKISEFLSFNGSLTQVVNAFYRHTGPRLYLDSAPKTAANAALVFSEWRGVNSSLSWRHISNYRLDGSDPTIRAAGYDIVDFALSKKLRKWVDLNLSVDNLLNKQYFETQNYFVSQIAPTAPAASRIHGTPGYPITLNVGLTFRLGAKE